MPLVIDKLTGQVYLFSITSTSPTGATSGGTYPEVNTYASLPPANSQSGKIYIVKTPTGIYMINRKEAGMYISNGVAWTRLGDIPAFFNDDNFQIYDGTDQSKTLRFQLSGITSGSQRTVNARNSDGTLAYLEDLLDLTGSTTIGSAPYIASVNITVADPGQGKFRWNNISQTGSTNLFIDSTTNEGIEIDKFFQKVNAGAILYIQETNNSSLYQRWEITGMTNNTGWWTVGVNYLDGSGMFNNNSKTTIMIDSIGSSNTVNKTLFDIYTGATETRLQGIEEDIFYLSGQTALKLNISFFNGYTGSTNTRFNGIESNITYLSGQTNLRLKISDFNTYSASTESDINYISGQTNTKLSIGAFNGYTASTETRLDGIDADIIYVSGKTDTKLSIGAFNTYSASTETRLDGIDADIVYVSGKTDTKLSIISFAGYTATTETRIDGIEADIVYVSGQTDLRLKILNFNVYSAATASDIAYISGQTDTKLDITIFSGYSATTETNFDNIDADINYLSGQTNTKLSILDFNSYSATTKTYFEDIQADIIYLSGQTDTKVDYSTFTGFTATTGLQGVTEIGAITTIESTFNGGLVTHRIKPTGDTITAIQITRADGSPVFNVDTLSGFTSIGTDAPRGLVHAYGVDNSDSTAVNTQTNAFIIDGAADVDKDVAWFEDGEPKWLAETYRNEGAEFWYLYNVEADNTLITVGNSGGMGVNKVSNLLGYHAALKEGTGLNDLQPTGLYTKDQNTVYQIKIYSTTGATDQWQWRKSLDEDGLTYGTYSAVSAVTTTPVLLEYGVHVNFVFLTGHTTNDVMQFIAFAQLPQATLSISPYAIEEIVITDDYTAPTVVYRNRTGTLNGGTDLPTILVFPTGSTTGAILLGFRVAVHGVDFRVDVPGSGLTSVVEYYNPIISAWTATNIVTNNLSDNTNSFKTSGRFLWNPYTFTDWKLAPIFPGISSNADELYWIRLRTASPPVISPRLLNVSIGNNRRFSVYGAAQDVKPKFYVDSLGSTNIGGGNITGRNILQINSAKASNPSSKVSPSLVEIDSEDSTLIDLKIKLASDDQFAPGLTFVKGRGTLAQLSGVTSGDTLFRIDTRGIVGIDGEYLGQISANYYGNGVNKFADFRFCTSGGGDPVERLRINHIGSGFGLSPTARIDVKSGSTTIAPLKFRTGQLLLTPQVGAVEFSGSSWYGTPVGGIRKTFAFLESPLFSGAVGLPAGTTLNNANLINYITISGGTNNPNIVKVSALNPYTAATETRLDGIEADIVYVSAVTDTKLDITDFNTYTGSTIPWNKVSKTGSNLNEFEIRNASDLNIIISEWDSTNVDDILQKVTNYIEDTQGSGRISPDNVLGGRFSNTLIVSAGTGYINYSGLHKVISWSATTFNVTGSTPQSLYYVFVDVNGTVMVSITPPSSTQQIFLGTFYYALTVIGSVIQSGCVIKSAYNKLSDFTTRMGLFIYDNGGKISVSTGNTLGIYSAPMKIQNGFLSMQNTELSTLNSPTFAYLNYYNNSDLTWVVNYYFHYGYHGLMPVGRWNDVTKTAGKVLTGHTLNFVAGSKVVTSTSDLTSLITTNDFICKQVDTRRWMNPVSGITWNGSVTTINLESVYSGTTGSGVALVDSSLPRIGNKFAKNLLFRTPDNTMALILAQTTYDTYNDAKNGVLPAVPIPLETNHLKMAYVITSTGTTDLSNVIFDIRPLPFSYREGGQAGGGAVITVHGQLSGLGADDHLQYLRTDGNRDLTGILNYTSHPTFTTDTDLIDKKYSDDADALRVPYTVFNLYTGTTAPSAYLGISNFNIYSATTLTNINSRLLKTTFNTFTGTTLPAAYLGIGNFNIYSATTLTNINSRLLKTTFNTFTGTTAPATYLSISNFNTYSGTTLPNNYYNKTQINSYSAATSLQIGLKAPLLSPALGGIPTTPTAIVNSSTAQIASTEFVVGQASGLNPLVNGPVAVGTSLRYAREDHVHPIDTSRLAVTAFNTYSGNTATAINGKIGTANNGLTKSGVNVHLGGLLTGATTVDATTFAFILTGTSGPMNIGRTTGAINFKSRNSVNLIGASVAGVDRVQLKLSATGATFTDSRTGTTATGLQYAADYSTNFGKRSLIDQSYHTGHTLYGRSQILAYASGATNINVASPLSIPFNRLIRNDSSIFTYTGGTKIKILSAGVYDISYTVNVTNSNGTAHSVASNILKNGTLITETTSSASLLGSTGAGATLTLTPTELALAANDTIELAGFRLIAGGGNVTTVANATFISIVKKH